MVIIIVFQTPPDGTPCCCCFCLASHNSAFRHSFCSRLPQRVQIRHLFVQPIITRNYFDSLLVFWRHWKIASFMCLPLTHSPDCTTRSFDSGFPCPKSSGYARASFANSQPHLSAGLSCNIRIRDFCTSRQIGQRPWLLHDWVIDTSDKCLTATMHVIVRYTIQLTSDMMQDFVRRLITWMVRCVWVMLAWISFVYVPCQLFVYLQPRPDNDRSTQNTKHQSSLHHNHKV